MSDQTLEAPQDSRKEYRLWGRAGSDLGSTISQLCNLRQIFSLLCTEVSSSVNSYCKNENELIFVKHLDQGLAYNKHPVYINVIIIFPIIQFSI